MPMLMLMLPAATLLALTDRASELRGAVSVPMLILSVPMLILLLLLLLLLLPMLFLFYVRTKLNTRWEIHGFHRHSVMQFHLLSTP